MLADADGDGLPDGWEEQFGVTNAALDDDHDGLTNLQEYQSGTNPTNAQSYLKVDTIALTNNVSAAQLTFFAVSNLTYTLQSRAAVDTGGWTRVADIVAASTNRVMEVIDLSNPADNAQKFYRLVTPRTPE